MENEINDIIKQEVEEFYTQGRTDDTSNVLDEIISELWDMNRGISYIPQGYEHGILDED